MWEHKQSISFLSVTYWGGCSALGVVFIASRSEPLLMGVDMLLCMRHRPYGYGTRQKAYGNSIIASCMQSVDQTVTAVWSIACFVDGTDVCHGIRVSCHILLPPTAMYVCIVCDLRECALLQEGWV